MQTKTKDAYLHLKKHFPEAQTVINDYLIARYDRTFCIYKTTYNGAVKWLIIRVTSGQVITRPTEHQPGAVEEAIKIFSLPI